MSKSNPKPISFTRSELTGLRWRKAQVSANNGSCIEVAAANGKIGIRDSKDPAGPVQVYAPAEWHAFVDGVKKGEFDELV